jgi:hypothetical protein
MRDTSEYAGRLWSSPGGPLHLFSRAPVCFSWDADRRGGRTNHDLTSSITTLSYQGCCPLDLPIIGEYSCFPWKRLQVATCLSEHFGKKQKESCMFAGCCEAREDTLLSNPVTSKRGYSTIMQTLYALLKLLFLVTGQCHLVLS